jgi:pyruvate dehydrogenase E1 component alpha subunit
MLRVRRFEEKVQAMAASGAFPGSVHLCIGQEAVAAGVCTPLREDDFVTSNHRGHGHIVAKGAELGRCLAELLGRKDGYCKGKGGSMHIADISLGIIGSTGIVGAGIPIGVGAGLSCQMRGTDQVSVCFFGDGAANQGVLHEALNLAALWSLPVVFVCDNNLYTELSRMETVTAVPEIVKRADAHGLPGVRVDGNDAFAVYAAAVTAVDRARAGAGPTLIEAVTYRIRDHAEGLEHAFPDYRPDGEIEQWAERDPIRIHRDRLVADGFALFELERLDTEIQAEVEAATEFALASEPPAPTSAFTDMWAEPESEPG